MINYSLVFTKLTKQQAVFVFEGIGMGLVKRKLAGHPASR
jgi:hypothetical protein